MSNKNDTPKKEAGFYEWSPVFLSELSSIPNVSRAARIAGTSRKTAYRHRESNSVFSEAWDDALQVACDRLEEEIWRRAVEGTDKPVIYQGEITDTYKEYSDTLIIFLAKAHRPEKFRDNVDVTSGGQPLKIKVNVTND